MTERIAKTPQQSAPPAAWDAIAEGFDRYVVPQEAALSRHALGLVGLRAGERFLDVAAGTGALSLPAARLGADVTATDSSPAMIERFRAHVREERLCNREGLVIDSHALAFPDDAFDVSASQFGVMLVPDQPRALREMARVTRPGGRVLMITFRAPTELDFLRFFISAVEAVAPESNGFPNDPPPLEFQASDPEVIGQRLLDAGLDDVSVESAVEELAFGSGDELWDWLLHSNPLAGVVVSDLTEPQRASVRRVLDGMLRERSRGEGPATLTNPVNIAIGTKPDDQRTSWGR